MVPVLAPPQASVLEVFRSQQGEGLCIGDPQIFIRFGGCNLCCDYCDTPESIPVKSGRRIDLEQVVEHVRQLNAGEPVRAISVTGGEPLMQVGFLRELLPRLKQQGHSIHLETNGTLVKALESVSEYCDWIAMDFKPESATGHDLWEAHRWFLEMGGNKVFVKMVLSDITEEAEFQRGVRLIASVRSATPLILQPATPWGTARGIPLARLTGWWAWATQHLTDVRILPQIHRLWQIA